MAEVWPVDEALSLKEFSVGDPAIDRARSIMTHHQQLAPTCEWGIFQVSGCHAGCNFGPAEGRATHLENSRRRSEGTEVIPARRACLSLRPCRISSSSFLVRSSSSLSRRSPSSRMRSRKSLMSSAPSGFVETVILSLSSPKGPANSPGWLRLLEGTRV